jgi:4-hydroxybenzoate polyprenyltransferase
MLLVIIMSAISPIEEKKRYNIFKVFIGSFRLMHFLQVSTVTIIGTVIAILILKGTGTWSELWQNFSNGTISIAALIFFMLTIFFQQGSCGIQNDYIDREIDAAYNKKRAIAQGWVSPTYAYWFGIFCFILFTAFSFVVGIWANTGYWGVLFVQGANLIGIFYNLVAKHRPISILPYFVGFPLIPAYVWLTFGGFDARYAWSIGLLILVSFPAHIANELPDFDKDVEYGNRNFAVFLGKKLSTIIYWLGILLIEVLITIVYFLYSLNTIAYILVISISLAVGLLAFILMWRNNWETNFVVFNIVTVCIGVETLGFFLLLGL